MRRFFRCSFPLLFFTLFTFACVSIGDMPEAYAKDKKSQHRPVKTKRSSAQHVQRASSASSDDSRFAALVVNASTGTILYEKNATGIRYPASLTKMMTLYLTFEALKTGRLRMDTMLTVSAKAAVQPPTNINLSPGDSVSVQTALDALIVRSANDVAMVMAEELGGTQFNFALMMNNKARQLGMKNTIYHNPSGLPETRQVTTALDQAKLAIALRRDFPEYYPYFSHRSFVFRGRRYEGHNRLLGRYPGADGLKTGFISASGFNLVTSVRRGNTYLVGVVMGGRTGASRDQQMIDMLDDTFISMAGGKQHEATTTAQADAFSPPPRFEEKPEPAPEAKPQRAGAKLRNWSIQLGTYPDAASANNAVSSARKIAYSSLRNAELHMTSIKQRGKKQVRARLGNLSEIQAKQACAAISAKNRQCILVRG